MGYESRLVVVQKWETDCCSSFGETVATLNLCGMPNAFFPIEETFENEIDKPVYVNSEEAMKDNYGKILRYTSVEKLLKVLYACEAEEHYRRTELAINTLKSFQSKDWGEIAVVHFGY